MNVKTPRAGNIIKFFLQNETASSADVFSHLKKANVKASLVTVKRDLAELSLEGILKKNERGRETSYSISIFGQLIADVDAHKYCTVPPDSRYGRSSFNFNLFESINFDIFSDSETNRLLDATKVFKEKAKKARSSDVLFQKELERFVIELSWKSSKIEGNTYDLLDTERLIKEGIEAKGHSKDESVMILNHKKAFDFVYKNKETFKIIDRKSVEKIHSLLVEGMKVGQGFRRAPVGVIGSKYKPLDNDHQIKEAMQSLFGAVNKMKDGYSKALLILAGISYIQPFEDGNKRTSRMMANAILMAYNLSPLSYRSVDEASYREAVLVFYELNSILPLKSIFIDQYIFATENYTAF